MIDVEGFNAGEPLQVLLDTHGTDVIEGSLPALKAPGMDLNVQITRHYGFETELPTGGVGRLVVRQVYEAPDGLIARLPKDHDRSQAFSENRHRGIWADARVFARHKNGLFIGSQTLISMHDAADNSHLNSFKSSGLNLTRRPLSKPAPELQEGMESLSLYNPQVSRELEPDELLYSKPSKLRLLLAALHYLRQQQK